MKFVPARLPGSFIIEPERIADERGFFARTFCRDEFTAHGMNPNLVQCSISFNTKKGTLRGMHYQKQPYQEAKLVRCTRGAIFDVIIDIRADSPTYKGWFGVELIAHDHKALYVPEGFAHGFLTLVDESEVLYQMSEVFHPECAAGVRWNDACVGIEWPSSPQIISDNDLSYVDLS
jgi:dTDP-4-dehydrorhamnose 3,5-epimerase